MDMSRITSRRRFVATLSLLAAGCVGGTDETGTDDRAEATSGENSSGRTDGANESSGGDRSEETDTSTREEEVESLPEPRPLGSALVDLYLADDREAVAEKRDLTLSGDAVQVEIRLTDDGTPPDEYLPEEYSYYGDTVIAYVVINDLVDLAKKEDVERVFRRIEPKTNA